MNCELKQEPNAADSGSLFQCKICNKPFDNLHRLQRHMMCHDMSPELRKFKCEFCNKAFKFKHHLKVSQSRFNFNSRQSNTQSPPIFYLIKY